MFLAKEHSSDSISFPISSIHVQPCEGTLNEVDYYLNVFACNEAVTRSTNETHFKVVYSHSLYLCPILFSFPFHVRVSESPPTYLHKHIRDLHAVIRCQIALSGDN